jgi:hypothetical protein
MYIIYMSGFPNIEKEVKKKQAIDEYIANLKTLGFISDPAGVNGVNSLSNYTFTYNETTSQSNPKLEKLEEQLRSIDNNEITSVFDTIVNKIEPNVFKKYPETSNVVGKIYYAINPQNEKEQHGGNNQIVQSTPYRTAENKKLWISIFFFLISAVMIFETFTQHYDIIIKFANAISEIIGGFRNTSIVESLMRILSGEAVKTLIQSEKEAILNEMGETLQQIAATPVTTTMDAIFSLFTGTESTTALHARQTLEAVLQMRLSNVTYVANQVQFTIKYAIPACVTSICGIFKYGAEHLSINNVGSVQTRLTNLETHLAPTPRNGGFRKRTIKHKRSKKSNMASKSHKKKSKVMKSKAMKSKKRTSHKSKRSKTLKRGRKH